MQINNKKVLAFFMGVAIIIFSIINHSNPILISSSIGLGLGIFLNITIRIIASVYCFHLAKKLNRSFIWGYFALIFPPLALMCIAFVSEKIKKDDINKKGLNLSNITENAKEHLSDENLKENNLLSNGSISLIDGYFERGNSNFIHQRHNDALNDFSAVIVLDPNHGEAYYLRGLTQIALGFKEKANSDFLKSKELGYKNADNAIQKYYQ